MPAIVAIGVGLVDVYPQKGKMYPGGNEYNIACYARELGARASFMGVFAPDETGRLLEEVLVERGVDVSHCRHADGYSNVALVELQGGNRVFTGWTHAAVTDKNPIQFTSDDLRFIKEHDIVCSGYASRMQFSAYQQLHNAGIDLCYDFSETYTEAAAERMYPLTRFGFFSCDALEEAQAAQLLEKAVALGCGVAVATRGGQGSMAYDGKAHFSQPALPATVVDTMGAGDSFITAFLHHWFGEQGAGQTPDLAAAMRAGAAFATQVIQREGALGVGFDVEPLRLADMINIIKEENT